MSAFSTLPTSLFGPNFRGNQPCHLTSFEPCHLGLHPGKLYLFLYRLPGSSSNTYCPHLASLDFLKGHFFGVLEMDVCSTTYCSNLLLPTATYWDLLLPTATYCILLLPTATYCSGLPWMRETGCMLLMCHPIR